MSLPKFLPGHSCAKRCPGVFKFRLPHYIITYSTIFVKYYFGPLGLHNKLTIIFEHMFVFGWRTSVRGVHEGGTFVRGWWTAGRPPGVDICPCSSYKAAVSAGGGHLCASCKHRARWTFVCQLETAAAVRLGWTIVYELQTFRFT